MTEEAAGAWQHGSMSFLPPPRAGSRTMPAPNLLLTLLTSNWRVTSPGVEVEITCISTCSSRCYHLRLAEEEMEGGSISMEDNMYILLMGSVTTASN